MRRIGSKILYWLAVLAVSVVVLIALVLFLESRDRSRVDDPSALRGAPVVRS